MSQTLPSWVNHFFDGFYAECDLQWPIEYQQHIAQGIMKHLLLSPGNNVFDQCCGEGYLAQALHREGCNVWGVDQSTIYIERAKNLVPEGVFVAADAGQYHPDTVLDGAVNWHTSLGYGGKDGAFILLQQLTRNLPSGKRFLIDIRNVEHYKKQPLTHSETLETTQWGTVVMKREGQWLDNVLRQNWIAKKNNEIVWVQENADCYHPSLSEVEDMYAVIGAKIVTFFTSFDDETFNPETSERMIIVGEML